MPFYHDTFAVEDISKKTKQTTCGLPTDKEVTESLLPQVQHILESHPKNCMPPEPSEIYNGVYVGTIANAENKLLLTKLGIKSILNCDGIPCIRAERELRYTPEWGIENYEEITAEDGEFYDIVHHFPKAFRFIDISRAKGRVLIYSPDVNRNGAIAIGYLIHKGTPLLDAVKIVKHKRMATLFNRGFMRQLILYAKDHGLLNGKLQHHLKAEQFLRTGRIRDKPRDSHLLQFI